MTMRLVHQFALVGLGGALGALARLGIASFGEPGIIGTFIANIAGCAALGILAHEPRTDRLSWFGATGFCGGLTTMSTFALELVAGVSVAPVWVVLSYAVISVGGGLTAFASTRSLGIAHSSAKVVAILSVLAATVGVIAGAIALAERAVVVVVAFVLAAMLGAGLRGVVGAGEHFASQVAAIVIVNVGGAFALSALSGFADPDLFPGSATGGLLTSQGNINRQIIVGVGFLGSFTTFSTAVSHIDQTARHFGKGKAAALATATFAAIIGAAILGRVF